MYTYRSDGLTLAYSEVGAGTPVLFIHGATATGAFEWSRLAAELTMHRCVMPDLRGHGHSEFRESGYSREAIARDLLQLIEHLDLGKPHVVGFSYGAEMALMLELENPGTARSLTLVSPGTGRAEGYVLPDVARMAKHWPERMRRLHDERHGEDHWRVLLALLQQDSAARPEVSVERLAAVACPTLLLSGVKDETTRRTQSMRFAAATPLARHVDVQDAAHAAHHQGLKQVAGEMVQFMREIDAKG